MRPRPALALLTAAALATSGCGADATTAEDFTRTSACLVSAPAGFADAGLGQAVFDQTRAAEAAGLFDGLSTQRVSSAEGSAEALTGFAESGCTLTGLVGAGGVRALADVAADHPQQAFLAVGAGAADLPENVLRVDFDLLAPAFLAGYAAAAASKSGTVALLIAKGVPGPDGLSDAFAAGVAHRAGETGDDVRVITVGGVDSDDTEDVGAAWAGRALDEGADVLVPFGSAAPHGVVSALLERAGAAEAGSAEQADLGEDAPAGEGASADSAQAAPTGEASDQPDAEPALPASLVWFGSDGSRSLPSPAAEAVVASIEPDFGYGMRSLFPRWPGDGRAPADDPAADSEAGAEEVGGIPVRMRSVVGELGSGVDVVAGDGLLDSVTGLGRDLGAVRDSIMAGEVEVPGSRG